MSSYARRTNLIEGVGNEVLVGIGALFGILVPMLMFVNRRPGFLGIHPESEENVATAREQIQRNEADEDNPRRRQANHRNNGELNCPICLGVASYAVETNCGHSYCGRCIITYWEYHVLRGAIPCPSCRTQVSLLLLNFTNGEIAAEDVEKQNVINEINRYNRRYSGEPRTWMEHLQDLPTLLRHAFNEFFSVGGLMWMFRFRIVILVLAAFLYLISPLDILPEAAFGIIGFLDDIFIVFLVAIHISIVYRHVVQARGEVE